LDLKIAHTIRISDQKHCRFDCDQCFCLLESPLVSRAASTITTQHGPKIRALTPARPLCNRRLRSHIGLARLAYAGLTGIDRSAPRCQGELPRYANASRMNITICLRPSRSHLDFPIYTVALWERVIHAPAAFHVARNRHSHAGTLAPHAM